jgi:hypothetical protein
MVTERDVRDLLYIHFRLRDDHNRPIEPEINSDLSVVVSGNATMIRPAGGRIPVKFNLVDGKFFAVNMGLTSLENAPDICGSLILPDNRLDSLDGCPPYIKILNVEGNQLTNFLHGPETVDTIYAKNNPFEDFSGLPNVDEDSEYAIEVTYSENLPLLRLTNASKITVYHKNKIFEPVNTILNNYAGQGQRGAMACAAELAKAGFKRNARW